MREYTAKLRRDEQVTLALRGLYEAYGYRKFRMNRFEAYDFYAPYRDFLPSGQIISFTDLDGKLMALRPDVTLSIVRKAREGAQDERLYYTEPVYRPARGLGGYNESSQVGVEYIGHVTAYAAVEMVSLAAQSLGIIGPEWMLDLSHTGYLGGLLEALPLDVERTRRVRALIEDKNLHELARVVDGQLAPQDAKWLLDAAQLSGPFAPTLARAGALARGERMLEAVAALESLYDALAGQQPEIAAGVQPDATRLRLDVSISGDAKYYSGIILRGYISGVPSAVLKGGRYDPLLARMGKPSLSAMGFAIYFDELVRYLGDVRDAAPDTVLLYDPVRTSPGAVLRAVDACLARGERVWAGTTVPDGMSGRVVEVQEDA